MITWIITLCLKNLVISRMHASRRYHSAVTRYVKIIIVRSQKIAAWITKAIRKLNHKHEKHTNLRNKSPLVSSVFMKKTTEMLKIKTKIAIFRREKYIRFADKHVCNKKREPQPIVMKVKAIHFTCRSTLVKIEKFLCRNLN